MAGVNGLHRYLSRFAAMLQNKLHHCFARSTVSLRRDLEVYLFLKQRPKTV